MAGALEIKSRKTWLPSGAPVRSKASVDKAPKREFFVHRSAFAGMSVDTKPEQIATMRAMYHHHVNVNKWADLGYSFVVFQPYGKQKRPVVYEARGWKRLPAGQANHNTGTLAVCVVTLDEDIKPPTVRALNKLFLQSKCEVVRGHKEVVATSCPGPKLMSLLDEIAKPARKKRKPPKYPGTPLKRGSRGNNVKRVQRKLKIEKDGIFGAKTQRAVKSFQRKNDLTVDGIVGPKTWKAIFA